MYNYIRRRLHLLLLLAFTLLTLPACVGARMGVSWPAIGLIDLNGETQIALAYNNEVTLLTPSNGAPAGLVNPVDGSLLRDNQSNPRTWVLRGSDNGGAQFHTAPIRIDDETVIVVDHNRRLLRVDSVIVEVQRSFPLLDKVVANPLEAGGVLYVPFLNGGLSAISLDDYRELWRFPTDAGIWAQPLLVNDMLILS
ncbi:MAG: hypothetical protein OXI30_04920, partial [Chloroflexota bacterium]|nr:hypothetical protein [Chloroflexota bacterium]